MHSIYIQYKSINKSSKAGPALVNTLSSFYIPEVMKTGLPNLTFCVTCHNFSCPIAFSRYERTHPNFVSQARETEIFGLQFGRPSKFLQGLWATGHKTRPGNFSLCFGVFRSVRRFEVFLELVFTPIAFDKKKCRLSADWTELF